MANDEQRPIYLTAEGYRRLEQRLQGYSAQLRRLKSPPPVDEAQDPVDEAGVIESADDVSRIADLISLLQDTLRRARPLDAGPADGIIRHGSTVLLRDGRGGVHRLTLLDGVELEAEPEEVALDSPLGRALLGRAAGEDVSVQLPDGERRFTIVSVAPYHPPVR